MSNNINPEETINVPLIYLMQLQYLAIQSIKKNHNDLLKKNDGNEELSKLPKPSEKSSMFNTISILSKEIGDMWHKEPLDVKMNYQVIADIAKLEHMQKYPEYKYYPHRSHEKKKRSKRKCEFSNNEISTQQNQMQKIDICSFSKTKSKTNHENNILSEQTPPLHKEINSENNEVVNQNCDNHSL
ncbi:29937_t:CDS:2 [Gigaspora margarita]|uniref:29937_t:CDS:1 n=1 Tax=Gigaspora margarita TaxID=4874 RepID=A0ABN7VRZ2_GIGMA|nr:29937_t:CDS:2 [Gigaspora margarita]